MTTHEKYELNINIFSVNLVYKESIGSGTAPFEILDNTTVSDGLIASHKAFWVKVRSGSQTVTFNESDKVTSGTTFIKSHTELPTLRMQLKNISNGNLSTVLIALKSDAMNGMDRYDAEILKNDNGEAPNLYTIIDDTHEVSINVLPIQVALDITVGVEPGIAGDFEWRFYDFDDIGSNTCLIVEDKLTNEWVDIRTNDVIVREFSDSIMVDRFVLHMQPIMEAMTTEPVTCFGNNDGSVVVQNLSGQVINFALYDANGALVREEMVTNNVVWSGLEAREYTVREYQTSIGCPSAAKEVVVFEPAPIVASFEASKREIDLGVESGEVSFSSNGSGAVTYQWCFSDNNEALEGEQVAHTFSTTGEHVVTMYAFGENPACNEVYTDTIKVMDTVSEIEEQHNEMNVRIISTDEEIQVLVQLRQASDLSLSLIDVQGRLIDAIEYKNVQDDRFVIPTPNAAGMYLLKVTSDLNEQVIKIDKR
jgi:PKD repeat protein